MYLTYEEYKNLGGSIEEIDFIGYERVARRKIDYYTYNRVRKLTEIPQEVQECLVDLVDYLVTLKDTDGKEIERERTDSYEIQFSTPGKNISKQDLKEYKMKNIIRESLLHTGLMYRGVEYDQ